MAKLRKMLGDIHDSSCVDMMHLIETQSKETLAAWALAYVKKQYSKIYTSDCLEEAMDMVERCLKKDCTVKELKPYLKAAREDAKNIHDPACEAASKAIACACAVVQTPTNALGFLFYGAAAKAYHEVGLEESKEVYDLYGIKEFQTAYASLKQVAVEDEARAVHIKWNC